MVLLDYHHCAAVSVAVAVLVLDRLEVSLFKFLIRQKMVVIKLIEVSILFLDYTLIFFRSN